MAGGARPWGGAAGEQDGQVAATVHRATDTIPHRRIMLPFVDEDRFVDAEQGIRVGAQHCQGVWVVEFKDTLHATACGLGLTNCLGPLDRDGGHVGEDLVQEVIQGPAQVLHKPCHTKRRIPTGQNA